MDERLVDYATDVDLPGQCGGVKWQPLYPDSGQVITDSARAGEWTAAVGMTFHEVRINANAHTLELVFADLDVGEVTAGYVPFAVDDPDRSSSGRPSRTWVCRPDGENPTTCSGPP